MLSTSATNMCRLLPYGKKLVKSDDFISSCDYYGFYISIGEDERDVIRCHKYTGNGNCTHNDELWKDAMLLCDNRCINEEVISMVRKGVCGRHRARFWQAFLNIEKLALKSNFNYKNNLEKIREQLVDLHITEYSCADSLDVLCESELYHLPRKRGQVSVDSIRHILLDAERTFPTHRTFGGHSNEAREGRASMFRVLAVYARYNPNVEYCQGNIELYYTIMATSSDIGMSYLAGMFLMQMDEVEAFWCLASILEKSKYLSGYFDQTFGRLKKHAGALQQILHNRDPELFEHFVKLGVDLLMFVTPWFMCAFTCLSYWDAVLAIWDHFIIEGVAAFFRVALALLELLRHDLLEEDELNNLLPLLLRPPLPLLKYEVLIPLIQSISLSEQELNLINKDLTDTTKRSLQSDVKSVMKPPKYKGKVSLFTRLAGLFFSQPVFCPPSNKQTQSSNHRSIGPATNKRVTQKRRLRRSIHKASPSRLRNVATRRRAPLTSHVRPAVPLPSTGPVEQLNKRRRLCLEGQ